MKNLLYVLVNHNTNDYIQIFNIFLESLYTFSDIKNFDLVIICDSNAKKELKKNELLKDFNLYFLNVPVDKELKFALLRKFDIVKFKKFNTYEKILYIDVDIIVQGNIIDVFNKIDNIKNNTLYAAKEGDLEGKYWYMNTYKDGNVEKMHKDGIHSFNSGMFMFSASDEMKQHFKNVKKFALDYYKNQTDKSHSFYDQTFMNYYFNMNRLSNTNNYLNKIYKMFPNEKKYYPNKVVLHVAGLGRYKEKVNIMRKYLDFIKIKKLNSA